jgi:tellurite methyltransferase
MTGLEDQFGNIDIYLFDQLLRGRIVPPMRVLDAGCGGGRNLVYLLRAGHEVAACDRDAGAVQAVRALAAQLAPHLPAANFRVEPIESMTFPDGWADVVIASAVLHFAESDEHFEAMVERAWRALKGGGMLFARLASTIGIEDQVQRIAGRRHRLPDGSDRYLVDAPLLLRLTERLGGELLDPIKTTVVQDQRSMTTWVVRKRLGGVHVTRADCRSRPARTGPRRGRG